jgi:hypothetical protein
MLTIIALIVAFSAGLYVGSSNADAVKKGMAVVIATATGFAAYVEAFKGWFQ